MTPPSCPECGRSAPVRESAVEGLWRCNHARGGCGYMWREPEPEEPEPSTGEQARRWREAEGLL